MALPALVRGADCGPLNPLQSLSEQFDKDRVQQDHFGPGRPGPSREIFRSHSAPAPPLHEETARFFSGQTSTPEFAQHVIPESFDLSSLRGNLPQQPLSQSPTFWTGNFLNQSTVQAMSQKPHSEVTTNSSVGVHPAGSQYKHYMLPINNPSNVVFRPSIQTTPVFQGVISSALLGSRPASETEPTIPQIDFPLEQTRKLELYSETIDADELSRTAGLLVDAIKEETNPKFRNSVFLGLMRQIRDKEVVVAGNNVVKAGSSSTDRIPSSTWAQDFVTLPDMRGKGKARVENAWANTFQNTFQDTARKSVHFGNPEFLEEDLVPDRIEDDEDRYWRQENEEYQKYWSAHHHTEILRAAPDWDRLQNDWDRFEATSSGIKAISVYQFQPNNPYLTGHSSTRNHIMHTRINFNESVLEKEAVVQNDLRNPVAWFELGVKQQENEREPHAIQALQRAIELDSSFLDAWLALAISYTNENDKDGACDAIEQWIRINERYEDSRPLDSLDIGGEKTSGGKHQRLIQCLMALARAAPDGQVDADVQTALGVLLNTCEDYPKARDCFRAALSVHPDDWLLYNRVGATLANNGQSGEALWYYDRALELNPAYIRARFNLGISYINMKCYAEAAVHILDALVLQENDASEGGNARGITSSALWECLRTTCLQLRRPELASLCDLHDLEEFRKAF